MPAPIRVVTWNCQGGFQKKWRELLELDPDLAVIQELTSTSLNSLLENEGLSGCWIGEEGKKGLAVIGFKGWKVANKGVPIQQKWFLPIAARREGVELKVLAVWAMPVKGSHENSYIGQVFDLACDGAMDLGEYDLVLGDFNASSRWDETRREKTFTAVEDQLKGLGFVSAYHFRKKVKNASEAESTFFMYRKIEKTYHIDYCFVGARLISGLDDVLIGAPSQWLKLSDHAPLTVILKLP